MLISLAQAHIVLRNTDKNVALAEQMIEQAARQHSNMILLPELWTSGYDLEKRELFAQENQQIYRTVSQLAQDYQIWIGGSWITENSGKFYNSFHLFNSKGQNVAITKKFIYSD